MTTDIDALATARFGAPNWKMSSEKELRFGAKGSVSVCRETGRWNDFETNTGGVLASAAGAPYRRPTRPIDAPPDTFGMARKVWSEGQPTSGTPVERYLASRGLQLPPAPAVLKFHPSLHHGGEGREFPGMLAEITDCQSGDFVGVHRTFLDPAGAGIAPIPQPRGILGRKQGGVIRLVPDDEIEDRLGLAEGIENALTAVYAGWKCWAAIDAGNLKRLPVMAGLTVTIFADPDKAGRRAAETLRNRCIEAGNEAAVIVPPTEEEDWNDRLCAA